jgi:hypothetical protein
VVEGETARGVNSGARFSAAAPPAWMTNRALVRSAASRHLPGMTRTQSLLLGFIMIAAGFLLTMVTHGHTIFYGLVLVGIFRVGRTLMTPE